MKSTSFGILSTRYLISAATAMVVPLAQAQSVDCPSNLKWNEATHAERRTERDGIVGTAAITSYANATVSSLSVEKKQVRMITMKGKDFDQAIHFISGKEQTRPIELAELTMIVEPPMVDGTWARFPSPCSLPDGVKVRFDQSDMQRENAQPTTFQGTLQRKGQHVTYSMTSVAEGNWKGALTYTPLLDILPMGTDVRGWHVYRGNTFLKTLDANRPVSIADGLSGLE